EHGKARPLAHADGLSSYRIEDDTAECMAAIHRLFPGRTFALDRASRCMYTLTPDEHFVLDVHPAHPHVVLGLGFSGHGFKCAPAVGEVLAAIALDGHPACAVDLFSARGFA